MSKNPHKFDGILVFAQFDINLFVGIVIWGV
jgi:hypothetical protein